ncbi:hypothetical protein [Solimicrobium silvestre]|uniref:Uncharacterized protein n=1 Tax=Solimicrobium silvestre TaxID=2099400 RepID=A0A2S9H5H1_9BURK|nr:hypothetical protein [Solimicrobium silvestre]PRC95235.1 hypothetical protein S2091_0430 [Solimicrobium silvestre]
MSQVPEQTEIARKKTTKDEGNPKFGRLLMVLLFSVFLIGVITWASEAYWS